MLTALVAIFANALPAYSQGEADFLKKVLQATALSPAEKASNDASQAFQKGSFEEALRLQQKAITDVNRAETPDIKMYKMYEHLTKYAEKAHNWQVYQESLYGQLDYLRKLDDQSTVQFIDIQLGGAEFQAQRYEPAIKLLQEAIKSTKGHVFDECVCNLYLALICENQKNAIAAKTHYEKGVGLMSKREIIPNTYSIIEKSTLLDLTKARLGAIEGKAGK